MSEEAVEGLVVLLNPRRTRTNMKLLQLVWIFLLTLCGQSGVTTMMVKEDGEAILDCSFSTNIEKTAFVWKKDVGQSKEKEVFLYSDGKPDPGPEFKDRVSHFPDQLRFGNASIKITKAKTTDSGSYTCFHATVKKEIRSVISLTVDPILKPRPEIEGTSPWPSIELLAQTLTSALLRCIVRGAFPKPEVVWTDSDGKILPADEPKVTTGEGNKYDIILNVTVTKTDHYRCVATQKEINHQVYQTIAVHFSGGASEPSVTILEETTDGVLLQCVVRGASPELKVFWTYKSGDLVPSKEQKTENSIILQTTVTKTDFYRCVTTEGKKNDEVYSEIYVRGTEETKTDKSSGGGFGVGTIVAVAFVTAVVIGGVLLIVGIVIGRRCRSNPGGSRGKQENGYHSTGGTSDD